MQPLVQQVPKQYLKIRGHSILELTLKRLDKLDLLAGIVLVLNEEDTWFNKLAIVPDDRLVTATGGAERALSVANGLQALEGRAKAQDWVLVHDVVRPCVSLEDIHALVAALSADEVGGLLVLPVRETLKKVTANGEVECTVPREDYRLAGTPQMFRYGLLRQALAKALQEKQVITDEAHAMELAGHPVKLVQGSADNIKITHPEDLVLAEFILNRQGAFL
jgi:2-C-methyl-D-erythritol 4-phosphate cytidylyltransferase